MQQFSQCFGRVF